MAEKKYEHAGAPTKYKKKYCQGIIDYFSVPPKTIGYKKEYFANGTIKSEIPIISANSIPTYQGYADEIGVHIDTLNEWAKKHTEFSEAYARAKQLQEKIWLVNGMDGSYNAQFAQFFGKNCLGYKDKTDIDLNADVNITLSDDLKDLAK